MLSDFFYQFYIVILEYWLLSNINKDIPSFPFSPHPSRPNRTWCCRISDCGNHALSHARCATSNWPPWRRLIPSTFRWMSLIQQHAEGSEATVCVEGRRFMKSAKIGVAKSQMLHLSDVGNVVSMKWADEYMVATSTPILTIHVISNVCSISELMGVLYSPAVKVTIDRLLL